MLIQRLLQLVVIAIAVMAGFGLLAFVLNLVGWLFGLAVKVLVVLVVVAAVLRFAELVRDKRRR